MDRLRLGLIGAGIAARELHGPVVKGLSDRFEVVAVCSRTAEKARALAEWYQVPAEVYTDYREMLARARPQAVAAALPVYLNLPVTRDCVEAGVHVLVEKPIGCNVEEGRAMVALAGRQAVTLFVAENFRYSPELQLGRRLVESGQIGRLCLLRWNAITLFTRDNKYVLTPWRQKPAHLGGFLSDGGVHQAAAMRLLGGPVTSVQAVGTTVQDYLDSPDTMLINLRFASGAIGQITQCHGALDYEARRAKLYGDRGTLVLSRDRVEVWLHDGTRWEEPVPAPNSYTTEFIAFHEAVTGGDRSADSAREALEDLRLIDAAIRSAASGATIQL